MFLNIRWITIAVGFVATCAVYTFSTPPAGTWKLRAARATVQRCQNEYADQTIPYSGMESVGISGDSGVHLDWDMEMRRADAEPKNGEAAIRTGAQPVVCRPNANGITVRVEYSKMGVLQIYSLDGKMVMSFPMRRKVAFIPLPPGVYFARVTDEKGHVETVSAVVARSR